METAQHLIKTIFSPDFDFEKTALEVFRFQYNNNNVYQQYGDAIGVRADEVKTLHQIPFLPIRFFKTHKVISTEFHAPALFESSGTTETINSKHYVKDISLYEKSFLNCFKKFYGNVKDWCIIGLLPSYLERKNSSLVYMVDKLISESGHPFSGFYLNDFQTLAKVLQQQEIGHQKTLLIGVTFALLDFAASHSMNLNCTTIMETGGMKGRRKEMPREEIHEVLKKAFGVQSIHSEYGMTELLSQGYSKCEGIFYAPAQMKILLRDEEDPLTIKPASGRKSIRGVINVIDLANIYSCSFIATDDMGILYEDGSFEVTGRRDNSDLRGCSLLTV